MPLSGLVLGIGTVKSVLRHKEFNRILLALGRRRRNIPPTQNIVRLAFLFHSSTVFILLPLRAFQGARRIFVKMFIVEAEYTSNFRDGNHEIANISPPVPSLFAPFIDQRIL